MDARRLRVCARLMNILALALLLSATPLAVAAPGDLDPSFGGDGKVNLDFNSSVGLVLDDRATDIVLDNAGRIVVVGWANNGSHGDFALARLNLDGSLDSSFGGDGKVTTDFAGCGDYAAAVTLDGAGHIIVAGTAIVNCIGTEEYDFGVARYNPDGTLDDSFGGDGRVTAGSPYVTEFVHDMTWIAAGESW